MRKSSFDAEFDVVVVGGGSAGCVLSARLTENPKVSLCVIEAGGRDRNPWIHIPMGFGKLVPNPKMNWGYETEPEPGLGGRTVIWPRGKVLGGSGSINGLVFLRGAPTDYDEWQRLGARGWSYNDVLPYFKRMEHSVDGANAWRGTGGPVRLFVERFSARFSPHGRSKPWPAHRRIRSRSRAAKGWSWDFLPRRYS